MSSNAFTLIYLLGEKNMADQRPGGLTALAVFNFIFGAFAVIGSLALIAVITAANVVEKEGTVEIGSLGLVYLTTILMVLSAGLLIASGVGYIKQKLFLGRKLGNAYACLSVIGTVIGLINCGGVSIGTIIGLIYPVLTLLLLNGSFKDDLGN